MPGRPVGCRAEFLRAESRRPASNRKNPCRNRYLCGYPISGKDFLRLRCHARSISVRDFRLQISDQRIGIVGMGLFGDRLMPESDGNLVLIIRGEMQGSGEMRFFLPLHRVQDAADD